jgi:hypothetical protein
MVMGLAFVEEDGILFIQPLQLQALLMAGELELFIGGYQVVVFLPAQISFVFHGNKVIEASIEAFLHIMLIFTEAFPIVPEIYSGLGPGLDDPVLFLQEVTIFIFDLYVKPDPIEQDKVVDDD